MPTTAKFRLVPMDKIIIENRGRKKLGDIDSLADSISRHGLLNPITIRANGVLVTGERRYRAHEKLKRTEIPAQLFEELDQYEARAVEIEENVRRLDLDWREEAMMVLDYHEVRQQADPEWTVEMTGDALGMEKTSVYRRLGVAKEIKKNPAKFASIEGLVAAYNLLQRDFQRIKDAEAEKFLTDPDAYLEGDDEDDLLEIPTPRELSPQQKVDIFRGIYNCPLNEWLEKDWTGERFSVLHCDFPYGIYHHESDQGGAERKIIYEDTPEIFWKLCETLVDKYEDLLETNAHIIFWYASHMFTEVSKFFSDSGFTVDQVPLIWFKSDNTGILPDPSRGPRRVYETALLMTKGDRFIVRPVSNVIAHPAARSHARHPSEKPLEVVTHFLRMVVDEHTRFLDPTCGGGTAVAAAENLGAKEVIGVEMDQEHAQTARGLLNRIRLAKLS